MHQSILSGHLGRQKNRQHFAMILLVSTIRDDLNCCIQKCDNCTANKPPVKNANAPIGDMRVGAQMDCWATDILGPFQYILVVTDTFSKWTEAYAIPDQTATTCAHYILNEMISRFGCPLDIHSDQGRN